MTAVPTSHRAGAAWWLALFAMGAVFVGARSGTGGTPAVLEPFDDHDFHAAGVAPDDGRPAAVPLTPPARVVIPSIEVRAAVRPVGIDADGALVTPPATETGWYQHGAVPGARGSAVVVGHVDSRTAPGVFAQVGTLGPGDLVGIQDSSGVWTIFAVRSLSQHPKEALPSELWAPAKDRILRLITCGGAFDPRSGHYRDNVVAHAEALGRWRPPASDAGQEPPWDRLRIGR